MAGENEISVGAEVAGEKLDSQNAAGGMGTDLRWPLLACDPSPLHSVSAWVFGTDRSSIRSEGREAGSKQVLFFQW